MEIIDVIKNNFNKGYFNKAMAIEGLPEEYPAWTIKRNDWYGVAVPADNMPFSEKFASARIWKITATIDGQDMDLLALTCSNVELRNEFALICAQFVQPGENGSQRKKLIVSPAEWWNNWNLENADFKTGVNLETYKKYIDFAASVKAPFLVVDAGWLKQGEKGYDTEGYGETIIDIPELVKYAKSKNIEVILWGSSRGMQPDYTTFLDRVKNWGIAGLKIDFMDRDDQNAMDFFENVAKAAAERKLVLDYHGCPKPVGLDRTYPNIVNYEGVLGNEWNKWSDKQTPRHKIDLVFTRMLCGPMDFTPGAMRRQLPALKKPEQVIISKSMNINLFSVAYTINIEFI